ncbi:MAG: hypothetical protein IPP90_07635 [Gemmatimonadaceae bacterium]|nr:hypothetical protein [Gemmatimonadaceae bacterium]
MSLRFAHGLAVPFAFAFALTVAHPSAASSQSATGVRGAPDSIADFGGLVRRLSNTGGYFNTDNLISNEQGYQQVLGAMDRLGLRGGAYIGVGPDQNFTYIARLRPRIAFIADIRRDNMLQHLMFKALFARARNRAEFLALWTGRPVPTGVDRMSDRTIQALVGWIDSTPVSAESAQRARASVREQVQRSGVALLGPGSGDHRAPPFHDAFITDGHSLHFTTAGAATVLSVTASVDSRA